MSTDHPEPTQEQFELADACIELGPANTWKAAQLIAARDARRDERLREILEPLRELEAKATKGPWEVEHAASFWRVRNEKGAICFDDGSACDEYNKECSDEDRDLLVALRNASADLLALLPPREGAGVVGSGDG